MAHFYTTVTNSRGGTTKAAGTKTGQTAHIRGWDAGVKVEAGISPVDGKDVFLIYATKGSNGGSKAECVGWITDSGFTAAE